MLGVGFVLKNSAFAQVQSPQIGLILIILLAVSLTDLAVIYVVKRRLLNSSAYPVGGIASGPQASTPVPGSRLSGLNFVLVIYALALAPAVYGFIYFLLGGSLNWFILFVAVTMLGFLLFKPKEEELKKFFRKET